MDPSTRAELDALRQQVASLSAAVGGLRRVNLREVDGPRFLGQPVTLIASVADAISASPAPGEPLTLTTTWGRLRWVEGPAAQEGTSVSVRTDAMGSARVTLRPDTAEDLLPEQEAALATTLASLDPAAQRPSDLVTTLEEMVRLYRWEANPGFRGAVDVYVRDLGSGVLEAVNAWDAMAAWRTIPVTVAAHAVSEGDPTGVDGGRTGSTVRGAAMCTFAYLDWLTPWLRTYDRELMSDGSLRQRLQGLSALGNDPGRLLEVAFDHARESIAFEPGRLGALVAPRAARAAMRGFVDDGISELPIGSRAQLVPAASAVSDAVGEGAVAAAGAITQSRADLGRQIGASVTAVDASVLAVREDLGGIRTQLAATSQEIEGFRGQIGEIDAIRSQVATNAQDLAAIRSSVDASTSQIRDMQTRVQALNTDVTTRIGAINSRILDINKHIGGG